MSVPCETDRNHRKGNLSQKPGNKTTQDRDSAFNPTESSHARIELHSVTIS